MENTFLESGYKPPKSNSAYMKFEDGENRFRTLSSAIIGYEYWNTDNKPVRSKTQFKETPNAKTDKNGKVSIKHFWAFVVYSRKNKKVMILEITQNGIQNTIYGLINNPEWGKPSAYDIIVNREGEGFDTKYNIIPCPHQAMEQTILDEYNKMKIDLNKLYTGEDPFSSETINIEDIPTSDSVPHPTQAPSEPVSPVEQSMAEQGALSEEELAKIPL